MTSGAVAQEDTLSPSSMVWMPKENCFCVSAQNLAKAAYAMKFARMELELKEEEAKRRVDAMLAGGDLKLKLAEEHCDAQLELYEAGCRKQLDVVLAQTNTLVSEITQSYNSRLYNLAELREEDGPHWFESPTLWGIIGLIGGVGVGAGVGAILWK